MATQGLLRSDKKPLLELCEADKELVADFINDCVRQDQIKPTTRRAYIHSLISFSRYHSHKAFREMTRLDVNAYLNSLSRSLSLDREQKWINSHNSKAMTISKFYKYVTQPELKTKERKPADICKDIVFHKRKEKTTVKAVDLWTSEDDQIFLKYLNDARLACFHAATNTRWNLGIIHGRRRGRGSC